MQKGILLILLFFGLSQLTLAQETIWKTLSKITYKKEMDEFLGFKVDKPVFSKQIKDLDGSQIYVKGFIIPVEGFKNQQEFVFSAYPYSMCFFCGGAGPETVMEVKAIDPIKYTAEAIIIKGTLELNGDDINSLMYQLKDVEKVDAFPK